MRAIWALLRALTLASWLALAGVPSHLWIEFARVAACESSVDPGAVGDNGSASGLLQIHWYLWHQWAIDEGLPIDDAPHNPVANIQLAYAIQEQYSIPRGGDRWEQWATQPDWVLCKYKLWEWLRRG